MLGLLTLAALASAQPHRTLADVPLFPGAKPDAEAASNARAENRYGEGAEVAAYEAPASPDDLLRVYAEKLSAKELKPDAEAADPMLLGVEQASEVEFDASFYDLEDEFAESDGQATVTGAEKREALGKARKPFRPDQWVESASLVWYVKGKDGALSMLQVEIEDAGLPYELGPREAFKALQPRSRLLLSRAAQSVEPSVAGLKSEESLEEAPQKPASKK